MDILENLDGRSILHIGTAHKHDSPFIFSSDFLFEKAFPAQNTFLLISDGVSDYKYDDERFVTSYKKDEAFDIALKLMNSHKVVVFHGLGDFHAQLVLSYENSDKLLWMFWGGEVYNNPVLNKDSILDPETAKLLSKNKKFSILGIKSFIRKYIVPPPQNKRIAAAAKKIKYIGVPYDEDFLTLKSKNVLQDGCLPLDYSYYPPEHVFKNSSNENVKGNNILLGNSATPENNHLEILNLLQKLDLDSRKIVTILSYGDMAYQQQIVSIGKQKFPREFNPIVDFMPLNDYNNLLATCSISIMNQYRQQGVGNILALLWIGTKVYLNEKNSMYSFLKRIGCHVFPVSALENVADKNLLASLNKEQALHNREVLAKELSTSRLVENLHVFFAKNFNLGKEGSHV